MVRGITITFESLERFNDHVVVDLGRPLTAIVGPNGSGKSTILEAVAELTTFLHEPRVDAPIDDVRRSLQGQRLTKPSWVRAIVKADLDHETTLAIRGSLVKHLDVPDKGASVVMEVSRRTGELGRCTLDAIALGDKKVVFDSSSGVVNSDRLSAVQAELDKLEKSFSAKIASLKSQLQAEKAKAPKGGNQINRLATEIEQQEKLQKSPETEARRTKLKEEIERAKNSAIRVVGGGEVAKVDVEALQASIGMPAVTYLQGLPNIGGRIQQLTTTLGALKDEPRSDRDNSPYKRLCSRLHALLKMDVTIDFEK